MENHYLVRIFYCIQSVSYGDGRSTFHHLVQWFLYLLLISWVKGWSSFIQEKHFGTSQYGSGYSNSLFLTTWNMRTSHADILVEPFIFVILLFLSLSKSRIINCFKLRIEITLISSSYNFFMCGTISVILNVPANSIVEKYGLLTHYAKAASQVMNVILLYIVAIKDDLPFVWIIETLD